MHSNENDAREAGINKGWDHANYVDAYGPDPKTKPGEEGARGRMMPSWVNTPAMIRAYRDGFAVGQRRFKAGRYPDGTKIDD